jgi:hypothetical protein
MLLALVANVRWNYRLTRAGRQRLAALGVVLAPAEGDVAAAYCVDWASSATTCRGLSVAR